MTIHTLTTDQKDALRHLICIRYDARWLIQKQESNRNSICALKLAHALATSSGDTKAAAIHTIDLTEAKECEIELRFEVIKIGLDFIESCGKYDKLPREVWLRALSVNESEWATPLMLKYGASVSNVVAVLQMENSATGTEEFWDIVHKPLHWCVTWAMLNASQTSPAFGKTMHDLSNEFMDGAFGEWKEPARVKVVVA
jgi:hypothetical protein